VLTMVQRQKHPPRPSPPHRPPRCARTRRQQQQRLKMQVRRVQRRRRLHATLQWRGNFRLPSLRVDWCALLCLCISPDVLHTCLSPSYVHTIGSGRFARRACAFGAAGRTNPVQRGREQLCVPTNGTR
jgi:hypothetical protein